MGCAGEMDHALRRPNPSEPWLASAFFKNDPLQLLIGLETLVVAGVNADGLILASEAVMPGEYRCNAPTLVA
jgi:hypothetical protein